MTGWFSFAGETSKKSWLLLSSIVLSMALQGTGCSFQRQSAISNKEENLQCLTCCLEIVLTLSLMILSNKKWLEWCKKVGNRIPVSNGSRQSKSCKRMWSLAPDFCPEEGRRREVDITAPLWGAAPGHVQGRWLDGDNIPSPHHVYSWDQVS